jgi:hypothetical protein
MPLSDTHTHRTGDATMAATKKIKPTIEKMPKAYQADLKKVHDALWDRGPQDGYIVFDSQWMKNPKVKGLFVVPVSPRHVDASNVGLASVRVSKYTITVWVYGCGQPWDANFIFNRKGD